MLLELCLIYGYLIQPATCDSDSNITVVEGNFVDGETLIMIGRRNNLPMLTLIGMAIRNLQDCEWTQWSACTAKLQHYFGTRSRTRTCSREGDNGNTTDDTEEDTRVCEGYCPTSYNFTEGGYCLKLYNIRGTWATAEQMCQNDSGHLVYIDTEKKFTEVKNMLKGFNSNAWIDARRKDVSSPWKNVHGDILAKFFWYSTEPTNGSNDLCILLSHADSREWYDHHCTFTAYPLCEVLV